jgi:hypothetical protein
MVYSKNCFRADLSIEPLGRNILFFLAMMSAVCV